MHYRIQFSDLTVGPCDSVGKGACGGCSAASRGQQAGSPVAGGAVEAAERGGGCAAAPATWRAHSR